MIVDSYDPYFPLLPQWAGQGKIKGNADIVSKWCTNNLKNLGDLNFRELKYDHNTSLFQIRDSKDWILFTLRWA